MGSWCKSGPEKGFPTWLCLPDYHDKNKHCRHRFCPAMGMQACMLQSLVMQMKIEAAKCLTAMASNAFGIEASWSISIMCTVEMRLVPEAVARGNVPYSLATVLLPGTCKPIQVNAESSAQNMILPADRWPNADYTRRLRGCNTWRAPSSMQMPNRSKCRAMSTRYRPWCEHASSVGSSCVTRVSCSRRIDLYAIL